MANFRQSLQNHKLKRCHGAKCTRMTPQSMRRSFATYVNVNSWHSTCHPCQVRRTCIHFHRVQYTNKHTWLVTRVDQNTAKQRRAFVSRAGRELVLDGAVFRFVGFNVPQLLSLAASQTPDQAAHMAEVLMHSAAGLGLKVARVWAFRDGWDWRPPHYRQCVEFMFCCFHVSLSFDKHCVLSVVLYITLHRRMQDTSFMTMLWLIDQFMLTLTCMAMCFHHRQAYAALQLAPGQYNESMFVALDHILAAAARHGVKVTLTLTNWHRDYGGIEAYIKWVKVFWIL